MFFLQLPRVQNRSKVSFAACRYSNHKDGTEIEGTINTSVLVLFLVAAVTDKRKNEQAGG